ncbi:glycosyltransferase family 4 protein [Pseudodesulfovibrio methanolicus]|uniref:Glycosyltransferase family 4 protein n=1 Tax=Pseudodesulfovibrio methanolicus TaxID=3126690 RepID=A0ABZ2J0Q6_9BACT
MPKRMLCLLTNLLGGKVISAKLKRTLEDMELLEVDAVYFDVTDYATYPLPRLLRLSSILEAAWVISQKVKDVDFSSYDVILVGSFEMLWPVRKYAGSIPTLVCLDSTPVAARSLIALERSSLKEQFKKNVLFLLYKGMFGPIFRKLKACFPRTDWCARSLAEDFRVVPERIVTCYPPLDLDRWKPKEGYSPADQPLRLLFVGNDFTRKGGEELLRLFEETLSPWCTLTIVSSDAGLDGRAFPPGVKRRTNIPYDEMPALFRQADVFVFPTRRDQLGLVVTEAMACGLPVIARSVGGLVDIVKDGWNGYLMPYDAPMEAWGDRIMALVHDRDKVNEMGGNSSTLAHDLFSRSLFDEKIQGTVRAVLAGEQFSGGPE